MDKPHLQMPIVDCGEPLVPIPRGPFAYLEPHPYVALGAPYGDRSPYLLRAGVLEALQAAQQALSQQQPDWRIQIFDAYRPISVQRFMVDYTFADLVRTRGLTPQALTAEQTAALLEQVYEFWAAPSPDPKTPPPHSTGAAVDVTLVDQAQQPVDMGSAIDELSPRSYPDYYAETEADGDGRAGVSRDRAQVYHHNRLILRRAMAQAGFRQHPREWWHFSWGDQMWAWLTQRDRPDLTVVARYGAI